MFKSCCARPTKKMSKSKSKSEKMDSSSESDTVQTKEKLPDVEVNNTHETDELKETNKDLPIKQDIIPHEEKEGKTGMPHAVIADEAGKDENNEEVLNDSISESGEDTLEFVLPKKDLSRKRYSVDYKRTRLDFKRFSVDCRRDSATLEELARLEQELARTNVDVRPGGRRKSSGILKSTTTSSNGVSENRPSIKPESDTDDDEVFEETGSKTGENDGPREPPATPVGRDELALRRHRFFSDLVCAARAAVEHRVRFDPLGPVVADSGEQTV